MIHLSIKNQNIAIRDEAIFFFLKHNEEYIYIYIYISNGTS